MLGPARSPAESWALRRALYEGWLAEPGFVVLIAEAGEQAVGYAVARVRSSHHQTWDGPDRVGELESFAVLPEWRRRGVGGALLDAVEAELSELGITLLSVSVVAANREAVELYERREMVPFLVSFVGRIPGG